MAVVGHGDEPHVPPGRLRQDHLPDLGLGDHVQHGADLVADQEVRAAHQGPGHAEALELPPGQLPGEPVQPGPLNAEGVQHVLPQLPALLQHLPQPPPGVDGLLRVLVDQLYRADPLPGQGTAVQEDLPLRGLEVPRQQQGQGGLAIAAGGEERHPLPPLHRQAHVPQDPGPPAVVAEAHMVCLKSHGCTSLPRPAAPAPGAAPFHIPGCGGGTGGRTGSPAAGCRRRAGTRGWG